MNATETILPKQYKPQDTETKWQKYWEEKIAFEQNFLHPYLTSPTSRYFFAHENGSLYQGEQIVLFRSEDETLIIEKIEKAAEETVETITPPDAWELYIK